MTFSRHPIRLPAPVMMPASQPAIPPATIQKISPLGTAASSVFGGFAASGARESSRMGAATPPNPPSFFRGFAASGARESSRMGAATPPNPPSREYSA